MTSHALLADEPDESILALHFDYADDDTPPDSGPHGVREDVPTDPETANDENRGATAEHADIRNAERLIALHGADLRYVTTWERWLAWDGTRWADNRAAALAYAVDTARVLYAERIEELAEVEKRFGAAAKEGNPRAQAAIAAAKAALKWAVNSQKEPRLVAMLNVAASFSAVAVHHDELNADAYVLNVANGTIDLRTGDLRDHRREDLCTMIAPTRFDPTAAAPTWERFIGEAMAGDSTMVGYLRRFVGYCLTGDVREHALCFFFGDGANGKSTFLGAVHEAMGNDYAGPAARGLLFWGGKGDRHPTELAALFRKRFVTCSEISDGATMDEALVKDVTGGDLITARRMREDFWNFAPTHKLIIAGNHKPRINGTDEGIWRRVRLVPWIVTIPKERRDKALPDKLRAELSGILAWAVRGCLEWQRDGLGEPPIAAAEATAEYRAESDALGRFVAARVTFEAGAKVHRKAFREAYEAWCTEEGVKPVSPRKVAERLRASGVVDTCAQDAAGRMQNAWRGARLKTDGEVGAAIDARAAN